jgi:DNA-binding NtrC family response regulator
MKILLLDDFRTRRNGLVDALQKKRYEVTACYGSNDFISSLEKQKFDILFLDMESWNRGKSIYNQFAIAKKLENLPIIFYNSNMNFSMLNDRARHQKDRILFKPTEVEAIVASLQENR